MNASPKTDIEDDIDNLLAQLYKLPVRKLADIECQFQGTPEEFEAFKVALANLK